jgi:hypothetical protein
MNKFKNNLNIIFLYLIILTGCVSKSEIGQDKSKNTTYLIGTRANPQNKTVKVEFKSGTTINFGKIKAGDTVKKVFIYKNIGERPFIIKSAIATCGCTVAYFNERPLEVGKTDSIISTYISDESMIGYQSKVVTINYNSPLSPLLLTMNGRVE